MRTLLKRVPCRSGLAGTVRDRPDARQPVGRITLSDRKKFQENALRAADRRGDRRGSVDHLWRARTGVLGVTLGGLGALVVAGLAGLPCRRAGQGMSRRPVAR